VEEYGLGLYREVLSDAGMVLPAVRVDELGARVAELTDLHAESVLLTPAHQFPTGYALSADRRVAVLEWARSAHRFVLEDDYDGEFRFDRKPIGALQGLDPDRVVYFGTASKSIAPALRLGWIVVPAELLPAVLAAKGSVETVSVLDQLTLAEFITSGAFDRHVRSRRQGYRRRREQLAAALAEHAPHVHLSGMQAGLQALLELPAGTEAATVRAAAARGLTVSGLAEFHHEARSTRDALVVNYSAVSESAWPAVLEALCAVLPR
jgi:GntR family transcriptional regulator/MocR family aminotransferase